MSDAALSRGALELVFRLINSATRKITGEVLFDQFGQVAPELIDNGYLTPTDMLRFVDDGDSRFDELLWNSDAGVYRYFSSSVGWVNAPSDKLKRYEVNMEKIFSWLGSLFEVPTRNRLTEIEEDVFWHMGEARFGKDRFNLYFVRGLESSNNLRAFSQAISRELFRAPLLTLMSSYASPVLQLPLDVAVVPLLDVLQRSGDQCKLDRSAISVILNGTSGIENKGDKSGILLQFSADYRTVQWRGETFKLTKKQASIFEALEREGGRAHKDRLQAEAETNEQIHRIMRNKKNGEYIQHPLWGTLLQGEGNGYYRLATS